jgi:hypothetical protein
MRAGPLQSLWPARSIDDDYADSRKFVGGAAQAQMVGSYEGKLSVYGLFCFSAEGLHSKPSLLVVNQIP